MNPSLDVSVLNSIVVTTGATWPRGPGSISSPLYPKTRMRMSSKSLLWTSPGNSRDYTSPSLELDLFYET